MAGSRSKSARRAKSTRTKKKSQPLSRLGVRVVAWILALGGTGLGLIGVLLLPPNTDRPLTSAAQSEARIQPQPRVAPESAQTESRETARVYEEAIPEVEPASPPAEAGPSEPELAPQPVAPAETKAGMLALVVDDLGQSLPKARRLLQLFGPDITWSVLPYSPHTHETVHMAASNGLELLLHVPMQPQGYPEVDPGPGSLFVDMDREKIREIFVADLAQIPGAVGVNNHMGSAFTAYAQGMQVVLQEIKDRGLFFMDSLTCPGSTVRAEANRLQVPVISRDVFLDNVQDVQAILDQLRKAERLARKVGELVAIGHPYPETLTALAKWSKERDTQVELVRLSRLTASKK